MRNTKEITIERTPAYRIYKSGRLYYLDTHKPIIPGFDTLAGARESAYYQELRPTKN